MRKLLLLLGLLLSCAGIANAQTVVNNSIGSNYTGSSIATLAAPALSITSTNTIVVFCRTGATANPCTSPTDTTGNSANFVEVGSVSSAGGVGSLDIWYVTNATGGSDTVTCNFPSAAYDACSVIQLSGLYTSPLDVGPAGQICTSGCTTGMSSNTFTTAVAAEIIIGSCTTGGLSANTVTAGAGYTLLNITDTAGTYADEYKIVSSLQTSITVPITQTNTSSWICTAVTFISSTYEPSPVITTTVLPPATQNQSYLTNLGVSSGTLPYTWSLTSGSLPTGLTLNTSTGAISGTPTGTGTSSFTVQVEDANSLTATQPLTLAVAPSPGHDGVATLPNLFTTTFPNTTGYAQVTVCASGCTYTDVATAMSSVSCGTVIKVTAGQSFQGVVNATNTCTNSSWIVVLSSDCTFSGVCTHIAAQGNRLATNPSTISAIAPYLATITGPNVMDEFTMNISVSRSGAAYYWFGPGLKITGPADGVTSTAYGTIEDDTSNNSPTYISHIVYDRDYVTCAAAQDCTRMFEFDGAYEAVVDSVVAGAHYVGTQSQAIWLANGFGPYKAVNDYLGASSQPIFSGGSGCPSSSAILPSDYEVAGDYLYYDFGSRASSFTGAYAGNIHGLEFKQGQRGLFQANVFDASAIAGLNAGAVNDLQLWLVEQTPYTCPWLVTSNITVRFMEFLHPSASLYWAGAGEGAGTTGSAYGNLVAHDNLFDDANQTNGDAQSEWAFGANTNYTTKTTNMVINHNTVISSDNSSANNGCALFVESSPNEYVPIFTLTNNICFEGMYGIGANIGGSFTAGTTGLNQLMTTGLPTITNNVSIGPPQATWPVGNFQPTTVAAVDFTNFNSGNGGNYQLTSSSPYYKAGTDGLDIGVSNWPCLNTLIGLATNGTYTEAGAACAGSIGPAVSAAPVKRAILFMH